MNLKVVLAFLVGLGLVVPLAPATAEQRIALVIGNGAYDKAEALPNPKNDAEDVAAALKRAGFETIVGIDLNKFDMESATIRFARKARNADVALFYYSGHALQFGGVNYLIPVDADLKDETDLRRMARLDQVVQDLQRAKNLRILVLDSCRDNPLAEQLKRSIGLTRAASLHRGLARIDSPQGMIVAFSTQAGLTAADGTGRNSPYTSAFLDHIETKEEIGDVFRRIAAQVYNATGREQLPELSLSLIGEYYLHGKPSLPVAPSADACSVWPQISATKSMAQTKAFLAACQSGIYNNLAKAHLSELEQQDVAEISDPPKPPAETLARPAVGQLPEGQQPSPEPEVQPTAPLGKEKEGKRQPEPAWWERARKERQQGEEAVEKSQRAKEAEEWSRRNEERRRVELARRSELDWQRRRAEAEKEEARRKQIEASNALAHAGRYQNGQYGAKDEAEAARWYRKAADLGEAQAMINLGLMYENGGGVAKDYSEAVRWYRKAAEAGHLWGMHNLAVMYDNGRGVAKDEAEAARWYRKAAEKGHARAKYGLSTLYENGRGLTQDRRAAARYVFDALRSREPFTVKEMTTNANAWSKQFRRELQRLLRDAGVYEGAIDGSFGPGTRRAIAVLSGAQEKPESKRLAKEVIQTEGHLGWNDTRGRAFMQTGYSRKAYVTLDDCRTSCASDSKCKAFQFTKAAWTSCSLYGDATADTVSSTGAIIGRK